MRQVGRVYVRTGLRVGQEHTARRCIHRPHAHDVRADLAKRAPHLIGLDRRRVEHINDVTDLSKLGHEHAKIVINVTCWDVFRKSIELLSILGSRIGLVLLQIATRAVHIEIGI